MKKNQQKGQDLNSAIKMYLKEAQIDLQEDQVENAQGKMALMIVGLDSLVDSGDVLRKMAEHMPVYDKAGDSIGAYVPGNEVEVAYELMKLGFTRSGIIRLVESQSQAKTQIGFYGILNKVLDAAEREYKGTYWAKEAGQKRRGEQ